MNNQKPIKEIIISLTAVEVILFFAGLISILCKPLPLKSKWKWIPLLFVNILGPIIYFAVGSKSLNKKAEIQREVE